MPTSITSPHNAHLNRSISDAIGALRATFQSHDRAEDSVARDDRRLIGLIATGSEVAFEELFDRYEDQAYRIARFVCRDDGRAEDAVQEAFLSIWRSPVSYRPQAGPVSAWLLTVVRNRAIDLARRNGRHADRRSDAEMLDTTPAASDVAADAIASADAPRLHELLAQIPEAQREVIVLAFYGQLTHTEIADRLDLPPGTVKGRMRLGLQKLHADIRELVA